MRQRRRTVTGFRCLSCGAVSAAYEAKCHACGGWDTVKLTGPSSGADRSERLPAESQAAVEKLAAEFSPGITRKRIEGAIRQLLQAGWPPAELRGLVAETISRHSREPLQNPLGYLMTLALRPRPGGDGQVEQHWDAAESAPLDPGPPLKPLSALLPKRRKRGRAAKEEPLPEEDVEECPGCGGAGMLYSRRYHLGQEPPELVPCPKCYRETLVAASGLRGRLLEMTLATLSVTAETKEAAKATEALVSGQLTQLLLLGRPGRGKTHIAVAALRACLENGERAIYVNVAAFLDDLRMSFEAGHGYLDLMRPVLTWPVCVLDDLGGERSTEWTRERLYQVIDARYGRGLKTIACSNGDPDDWDPRIASRLRDANRGAVVVLRGSDWRLKRRAG